MTLRAPCNTLLAAALSATALLAGEGLRAPPLGLDAYMPAPEQNPLTPAKAGLGRKLFFDKVLSRDRSVSCASCHDPDLAFTDDEPIAVGVEGKKGNRRTPRLINRGYGRLFFWDGRAASLEEQVLEPIQNPIEMDLTLPEVVARLAEEGDYAAAFSDVFGGPPSERTLAFALASYVRTILSGNSPYDRYLAGGGEALSEPQQRGLEVFLGKGNCAVCHLGPNLTDEEFHNTGVGWERGKPADVGRFEVTGAQADLGAFKTPGLREVAITGPYMHDGSLATLEDVVEFYDNGGEPNPALDPDMQKLNLTEQEKQDLVEFMKALNGELREGM